MKKHINKHLFLYVISLQLIITLFFLDFKFETNDELAITHLLSGSYTGKPEAFVGFLNIILATIIKSLFETFDLINWYTCFLIFYANVVFVFANYILWKYLDKKALNFFVINTLLFIIFINLYTQINFSKIASIGISVALTSILLIKLKPVQSILAVLIVFVGSMIRFEILFFVFIFILPLIIFKFKKIQFYNNRWALVFSIFISIGAQFIHKYCYNSNDEWAEYQKTIQLKRSITTADNHKFNLREGKRYLNDVNWSENDFLMASNFMWDKGIAIFDYNKLEIISNKTNVFAFQSPYSMVQKLVHFTIFITTKLYNNGLLIILLIQFILVMYVKNNRLLIYYVLCMFYVFFFLFLISVFSFINIDKDRIIWCAFLPGIIAFIYLKIEHLKNILSSKWMSILLIISSLFLFSSKIDFRFSKFYLNNRITVLEELDNYFEEPFVSWIGFESENIFLSPSNSRKAIMMGWLAGTPHNINKVHKLCNCNNVEGVYGIKDGKLNWLFHSEDEFRIKMVKTFYNQHYNSPEMKVQILKLNSGFEVKVLTIIFN